MNWLTRARKTGEFHSRMLKENGDWPVEETARAFGRSTSGIYDDLLICQWLKTHEQQILKFRSQEDVLSFIRAKRKLMRQELIS